MPAGELRFGVQVDPKRYLTSWQTNYSKLRVVIREAQRFGFLGPGPASFHIGHSSGFVEQIRQVTKLANQDIALDIADLGSGGGVPGLVVAWSLSSANITLIEAGSRRSAFLLEASSFLGLSNLRVVTGRAENIGRDPDFRGKFDVVMARSFGPPSATAECSVALISKQGFVVVSEPPHSSKNEESRERWPAKELEELGLTPEWPNSSRYHFVLLKPDRECPTQYPRRNGVPFKKPLY